MGEDPAWTTALNRYARFEREATSGAADADGAVARARAALLLIGALSAVAIWAVSRRSSPATA